MQALVRRAHEERVLAVLRERGGLSRAQIATRTGLSRTTLSEITSDLLSRGAIVVVTTDARLRAGSGRPAELLALDPSSGQFLGVDVGHTRVRVAVADATHEIMAQGHSAYPPGTDWNARLAAAFSLVERIGRDAGVTFTALQGVGVGVAGPHPAAEVREQVLAAFAERFGASVLVDNNTRFAALAEAIADGSEARDVLYVRLSHGIGGGLVVGGRLITGGRGVAGEFGHVTVEKADGLCRCGKRGCLETVASVPAALRACADRGRVLPTLGDLTTALAEGDPVAGAVIDDVATAVGRVLADASLILDPEQIVIGGSLTRAAPGIVTKAAAILARELQPVSGSVPVVRAAKLGDDDGARGAIAALFRQSPLLAGYPGPVGSAG